MDLTHASNHMSPKITYCWPIKDGSRQLRCRLIYCKWIDLLNVDQSIPKLTQKVHRRFHAAKIVSNSIDLPIYDPSTSSDLFLVKLLWLTFFISGRRLFFFDVSDLPSCRCFVVGKLISSNVNLMTLYISFGSIFFLLDKCYILCMKLDLDLDQSMRDVPMPGAPVGGYRGVACQGPHFGFGVLVPETISTMWIW